MKNIKTINALFEQAKTVTKFKLLTPATTKPAGSGSTRIQWQYQFSWPAKQPLLGDVKELINTINNAKDGDAQQVLSAIRGSDADKTHTVGILRAAESTQNNRIFAKDLGEFTGWIYLFYPDTINDQAIPANQKIDAGIDGRMTYLLDTKGEFKKYFKAPGTGKPAAADTKTGADTKPATVFTLASLTSPEGAAHDWFNSSKGLRIKYLNPVYTKIGKNRVPITTSGSIVPIFWGFVSKLPEDLATSAPARAAKQGDPVPAELQKYSQNLKAAIQKLFTAAAKYDQSNFSVVDIDELTQDLYAYMVYAVVILGLNSGKIDTNSLDFDNNMSTTPYYGPLKIGELEASAIVDPPAAGTVTATATTGFDGTAINNEMDLAKIISGAWIGYGTKSEDVDSLDKVKALFNAKGYAKKFEEISSKLPFKKTDTTVPSKVEFQVLQYFIISQKGFPYGPKTVAGFKTGFEKSSIK